MINGGNAMLKNGEVIKGNVICQDGNCQKEFTWVYQNIKRQSMLDSRLDVIQLYKLKKNESSLQYNADGKSRCYCPKSNCGYPNYFEVEIT